MKVTLTVNHSCNENDCVIQLQKEDSGPGIPVPMLQKIFESFVRVSEARDRESGGYGPGLPIADRAIHAHRGEIHASNHVGGRQSPSVYLPCTGIKSAFLFGDRFRHGVYADLREEFAAYLATLQ